MLFIVTNYTYRLISHLVCYTQHYHKWQGAARRCALKLQQERKLATWFAILNTIMYEYQGPARIKVCIK